MSSPRYARGWLALLATLGLLLAGCSGSRADRAGGAGLPSPTATTNDAATDTADAASSTAGSPIPPGFVPASVSYADSQNGFALGLIPCGGAHTGLCTALALTSDGGAHWVARTPPSLVPTDLFRRAIVRFADAGDGFAALGALQSTHDGARSWQPVALPRLNDPQVVAVEAAGGFVYVVAGERGGATPLRLYVGAAQVDAFVEVAGVALPPAGTDIRLSAALGATYLVANTLHGTPRLLTSEDAVHWATRTSPCPAGSTSAVAAGDPQHVTVVCDGAPTATGAPKSVYRSADAGLSFTQAGGPAPAGFTAAAGSPDPQTVVVAASARIDRLYRSGDAGRTFDVVYASGTDASGSGLGFADLSFTDTGHGSVVLGDAGIYARDHAAGRPAVAAPRLLTTVDGGQHWAQTVIRS